MKKILYSLFAVLALSCTFVSCSDDEGDAPAPAGNPATAAAGTYTGTWTKILDTDTVSGEGTMTITATDSAFTADFNFVSAELGLDASSVANISYNGNSTSFDFANGSANNGLGYAFAGKIFDGVAKTMFSLKQKVGRKSYEYQFRFVGNKTN